MTVMKAKAASLCLLLLAVVCVAQNKTATIKGKVRAEKGSAGGAAVILLQGDREVMRTTADKSGNFVLSKIPPGTYSVKFRKPGLSVGTIDDVLLKAGQTRTFRDLILSVDEGSIVFIRGSVFSEDGRSVPGVRVELARVIDEKSTQKLDSRITGETGEFVFRLPPEAAVYRLTLKADGAEMTSKDVAVESAAVYRVALNYKRKT